MTSPDDETDDLQAAGTLDAVWLLLLGGGRRESTPAAAELVLRRWHASQRAGAGTTVRLLLTDRRWSRCSHRLIAAVEHSGELDDDDLDELAVDLLQPGPLLVTVPGYVFADSARRGDYLIIYRINDDRRTVDILDVEHRSEVYRRR